MFVVVYLLSMLYVYDKKIINSLSLLIQKLWLYLSNSEKANFRDILYTNDVISHCSPYAKTCRFYRDILRTLLFRTIPVVCCLQTVATFSLGKALFQVVLLVYKSYSVFCCFSPYRAVQKRYQWAGQILRVNSCVARR